MHDFMLSLKKVNWTTWILVFCLGVAAFLRLYNFSNTLQFLGDQGRDAIVAKQILIDHNPVLIGPVTSTGNMYLGPLYYYFMVPFLAASYPDPVGPAYAVAFFSIITVGLMYYLGKELVGEKAALIGALLASMAATLVYFSRFSWNPNLSPLVTLILAWATFRAVTKNTKYWLAVGLCLAVLIQLHYITLLCVPAAGLIWLAQLRHNILEKKKVAPLIVDGVLTAGIFILSFAPLALFDIRHNFVNSQSFIHFMTADLGQNQATLLDRVRLIVTRIFLRSNQTLFQQFVYPNIILSTLAILGFIACLFSFWKAQKKTPVGFYILLTYLVVSILGLGYYRGAIFNHYIIYLLPLSMLLWGVALSHLLKMKSGMTVVLVFAAVFVVGNFSNYHLENLGWTVNNIKETSGTILGHLRNNESYNIVLLSDSGDIEGQNYRYFLDVSAHPPLAMQDWGNVDTLFIINEDHKLKKVVDSPIYEIVVFPNKTPSEVYTVPNGPEITVLRRK